jgi:hypothetical protein
MKIKKIIAREGLVIIGLLIVITEGIFWAIDYHLADFLISHHLVPTKGILFPSYFYARIIDYIMLLVYPFYLFIRFILWAVITLTEKEPSDRSGGGV